MFRPTASDSGHMATGGVRGTGNDAGSSGRVEMFAAAPEATNRQSALDPPGGSEAWFRQIADAIGVVWWLADARAGNRYYLSSAYEGIWGRSCRSLYANPTSFIDAIHPEDRPRATARYREMCRAGDIEYRVIRPDGSVRWIRDRIFPIPDADG